MRETAAKSGVAHVRVVIDFNAAVGKGLSLRREALAEIVESPRLRAERHLADVIAEFAHERRERLLLLLKFRRGLNVASPRLWRNGRLAVRAERNRASGAERTARQMSAAHLALLNGSSCVITQSNSGCAAATCSHHRRPSGKRGERSLTLSRRNASGRAFAPSRTASTMARPRPRCRELICSKTSDGGSISAGEQQRDSGRLGPVGRGDECWRGRRFDLEEAASVSSQIDEQSKSGEIARDRFRDCQRRRVGLLSLRPSPPESPNLRKSHQADLPRSQCLARNTSPLRGSRRSQASLRSLA